LQKYNVSSTTYCFTDEEVRKIHAYLHIAESQGLEHPTLILACRLQFEFAGRGCEIVNLEWEWVNFQERRIEWPDSKTGSMDKVMSDEAFRLLSAAHRHPQSPFICPTIFDPMRPLAWCTYYHAWSRFLRRAGVRHAGTHAIRHRAATEIANSGVPIKDGMAMTGHKTVDMFLRYVHPDEKRVRKSVEKVSAQRQKLVNSGRLKEPKRQAVVEPVPVNQPTSSTAQGNYRAYRRRNGPNREPPQDTRSAARETTDLHPNPAGVEKQARLP